MGEVPVGPSSEKIIFELDADHMPGVIGTGCPFPEPCAHEKNENDRGDRQECPPDALKAP
jgi:hypothetical protein